MKEETLEKKYTTKYTCDVCGLSETVQFITSGNYENQTILSKEENKINWIFNSKQTINGMQLYVPSLEKYYVFCSKKCLMEAIKEYIENEFKEVKND